MNASKPKQRILIMLAFVLAGVSLSADVFADPTDRVDVRRPDYIDVHLWSREELKIEPVEPIKENTLVRDVMIEVRDRTNNAGVKEKMQKAYGPSYGLDRQVYVEREESFESESETEEFRWMHANGCLNACGESSEYDPTDPMRLHVANEVATVMSQKVIDRFETIQKIIAGLTFELNFASDDNKPKPKRFRDNIKYGLVDTTPDVAELDVEDTTIFTTPIEEESRDEYGDITFEEDNPYFFDIDKGGDLLDETVEREKKEEFVGFTVQPLKAEQKKKIKESLRRQQQKVIKEEEYFSAVKNFKPNFRFKAKPAGKLIGGGASPFSNYSLDFYHVDGLYRLHHEQTEEPSTSHYFLLPIISDLRIENKIDNDLEVDTVTLAGIKPEGMHTEFLLRDKVKEDKHTVEARYSEGRNNLAISIDRYAKEALRAIKGAYTIQAKLGMRF